MALAIAGPGNALRRPAGAQASLGGKIADELRERILDFVGEVRKIHPEYFEAGPSMEPPNAL